MEARASKLAAVVAAFFCFAVVPTLPAQLSSGSVVVPPKFNLDLQTAARLRPQLMAQSIPASGKFATGVAVLNRLVEDDSPSSSGKFAWQLRIVEDGELNAYASPDGVIYVETGLARLAGLSGGLWAAILSHEVAHVVRRDWARRYLYQKSIERDAGAAVVLGDPGLLAANWADSNQASQDLAHFCRQLEIEADRDGLMLMARAGYHPDFMPALHHLMHAEGSRLKTSRYAMHPCWEERDRELSQADVTASIEFAHRWNEWYASPGGNPPVLVFAEEPRVRRSGSGEWEIQVPMRCQNLVGAVELVLQSGSKRSGKSEPASGSEIHQLTGCTSPRTTVIFTLASDQRGSAMQDPEIYVLDAWGSVLARTDLPRLH